MLHKFFMECIKEFGAITFFFKRIILIQLIEPINPLLECIKNILPHTFDAFQNPVNFGFFSEIPKIEGSGKREINFLYC